MLNVPVLDVAICFDNAMLDRDVPRVPSNALWCQQRALPLATVRDHRLCRREQITESFVEQFIGLFVIIIKDFILYSTVWLSEGLSAIHFLANSHLTRYDLNAVTKIIKKNEKDYE